MSHTLRLVAIALIATAVIGCAIAQDTSAQATPPEGLEGFEPSSHFGEWVREAAFDPDARYVVNAPGNYDASMPTQIIYFGLPNGNSIEWTIGRQMEEGLDWHFDIQHIGAQVRRLREVITDRNIVVVYLEANPKSWPHWRSNHENSNELIAQLYEEAFPRTENTTWMLSGHSGGGSMIFGYINGVEQIPDHVTRIAFLDANYAYNDDEDGHGDKFLEWLNRSSENEMVVVAYDDRHITYEGNRVVSDTGGTYRATTERMMRHFRDAGVEFDGFMDGPFVCWVGLDGQLDVRVNMNPNNEILHTVLVGEMNGLIHAVTVNTPYEEQAGRLEMRRAYEEWIQPGE